MNAGSNYNCPKVNNVALVKFGYLLEHLRIRHYFDKIIQQNNMISENVNGADNQQERFLQEKPRMDKTRS